MKLRYCSRLEKKARRQRYRERSKYRKLEEEIMERLRKEIEEKYGVKL
ncbi:MAG: hypothetical protein QXR09_00510 [Candidatus Aenigmatarchaeota archaeon]